MLSSCGSKQEAKNISDTSEATLQFKTETIDLIPSETFKQFKYVTSLSHGSNEYYEIPAKITLDKGYLNSNNNILIIFQDRRGTECTYVAEDIVVAKLQKCNAGAWAGDKIYWHKPNWFIHVEVTGILSVPVTLNINFTIFSSVKLN